MEKLQAAWKRIKLTNTRTKALVEVADIQKLEKQVQANQFIKESRIKDLVVAIKDNISTKDFKTTCSSRFLQSN